MSGNYVWKIETTPRLLFEVLSRHSQPSVATWRWVASIGSSLGAQIAINGENWKRNSADAVWLVSAAVTTVRVVRICWGMKKRDTGHSAKSVASMVHCGSRGRNDQGEDPMLSRMAKMEIIPRFSNKARSSRIRLSSVLDNHWVLGIALAISPL